MKTVLIRNYTFSKANKTITFGDFAAISLDRIISVTNVTKNKQLFYYKYPSSGGTVATNVLTLTFDTNTNDYSDSDKLIIEYNVEGQMDTIIASAARTATGNDASIRHCYTKGAIISVDVTAASGTDEELVVKLQRRDHSGTWIDVTGAATATITGTGQATLVIHPSITASANAKISDLMPPQYRIAWTIAGTDTPTFTFSVSVTQVD